MACDKCEGAGKRRYSILPSHPDPVNVGDGTIVQDMGGSGTRACECVRDLAPVDGSAAWWESESLHSEVIGIPIGDECIEIEADGEVPRGEDGRRVHRTLENAYYPALVRMTVAVSATTMHGDTARDLAAALLRAADACDRADAHIDAEARKSPPVSIDEIPF